jgi:hypothetical protein
VATATTSHPLVPPLIINLSMDDNVLNYKFSFGQSTLEVAKTSSHIQDIHRTKAKVDFHLVAK